MVEMPSEDLLKDVASQQKHYVIHLAEVNKSNDVISTQDIFNQNGLLVARKGARINHEVAERILQHRLLKPLQEQVLLENTLSKDELQEDIRFFIHKYPDVMHIHSVYGFQETIDLLFKSDVLYQVLLQELTIMRQCLSIEYEKTLFCAWLSVLIAKELGMQADLIKLAFLAGVTHDIGLLHISPGVMHKKEKLTANEWRTIQSHVIIGHLLLQKLDGENSVAANAVLEHHECCDGSGYPVGKTGEQLDIMGQIIGMADSIEALRVNDFSRCGRNLRDLVPYLHMNKHTHSVNVYNSVCSILQKSGLRPSNVNPLGDMKALASHLKARGKRLQQAVELLDKVLELCALEKRANYYCKLTRVAQPVAFMLKSSGLVESEILDWLEVLQIESDNSDEGHLTEMDIMQNELCWQLKKVCKALNEYIDKDCYFIAPEQKNELWKISTQIEASLFN